MRVKICGIQNESELESAVAAGADAVGFQVGQLYASRSFILPSTARRLVENLPVFVVPVLVTHLTAADAIYELMEHAGVYTVQIAACKVAEVAKLRDLMPDVGKIIYTEYVHEPINEMTMAELMPLVDAINLDCYNLAPNLVGTETPNKCHAWAAGAEYVRKAQLPVILSGHLDGGNVSAAIQEVRPFAVDGCARLKREDGFLDAASAREFVWNAQETFIEIKQE
ncbi:MAG: hypothetical protein AB7F40_01465 [Victivallaceae bacterium]|nr:hypothetical protein [Victivallaceae bacterium]